MIRLRTTHIVGARAARSRAACVCLPSLWAASCRPRCTGGSSAAPLRSSMWRTGACSATHVSNNHMYIYIYIYIRRTISCTSMASIDTFAYIFYISTVRRTEMTVAVILRLSIRPICYGSGTIPSARWRVWTTSTRRQVCRATPTRSTCGRCFLAQASSAHARKHRLRSKGIPTQHLLHPIMMIMMMIMIMIMISLLILHSSHGQSVNSHTRRNAIRR